MIVINLLLARRRPPQWPWAIKLYKNDDGTLKGDGTVSYEDPAAAQSAPDFFNGARRRGGCLGDERRTKIHHASPSPPLCPPKFHFATRRRRLGYCPYTFPSSLPPLPSLRMSRLRTSAYLSR